LDVLHPHVLHLHLLQLHCLRCMCMRCIQYCTVYHCIVCIVLYLHVQRVLCMYCACPVIPIITNCSLCVYCTCLVGQQGHESSVACVHLLIIWQSTDVFASHLHKPMYCHLRAAMQKQQKTHGLGHIQVQGTSNGDLPATVGVAAFAAAFAQDRRHG
jgi:hypothetical protein